MKYIYIPKGVCSRKIELEIEGEQILSVRFFGGCNGNLKGISSLLKGQNIKEVIDRLSGIQCGLKETSCPDQLAIALREALELLKEESKEYA